MRLVVVSPERDDPRETAVLGGLFAAGLVHYHVRKPEWSREKLAAWLRALPREWCRRLVLHQHHDLVNENDLAGWHWRDDGIVREPARELGWTSRSCHDLGTLRASLGRYDSVFLSPIFPSLSKPGRGPNGKFPPAELGALLAQRTPDERRTRVLALGGITAETAPRALALGFDGVAALGAIWQAADPVRAFAELQNSLARHAA